MGHRLLIVVANCARLAGAAVLVIGMLFVLLVLVAQRKSRGSLRYLIVHWQREALQDRDGHIRSRLEAPHRGDRGAVSLVEMVVVTAMASVLLFAIASVAMVSERSAVLASSNYGAARRANTALSSAMSAISDASPIYGCVLTDQGEQLSGSAVYSQPLTSCAQTEPQPQPGPIAVEAISPSSGWPQGLCWYSYPAGSQGLVPPDLRCLVSYSDHTIWSFDWPPVSGTTYTSCNPNSCFGTGAPAPGALPSEPSSSTANVATFAGRTAAAQPFTFTSNASCSPSDQTSTLSAIKCVSISVIEDYGGLKSEDFAQSYTYKAEVGSAEGSGGSWQTI